MKSVKAVNRPHTHCPSKNQRRRAGRRAKNERRRIQDWSHRVVLSDPVARQRLEILASLAKIDAKYEAQGRSEAERAERAERRKQKKLESGKVVDEEAQRLAKERKEQQKLERKKAAEEAKKMKEEEEHRRWQQKLKQKEEDEKKRKEQEDRDREEKKKRAEEAKKQQEEAAKLKKAQEEEKKRKAEEKKRQQEEEQKLKKQQEEERKQREKEEAEKKKQEEEAARIKKEKEEAEKKKKQAEEEARIKKEKEEAERKRQAEEEEEQRRQQAELERAAKEAEAQKEIFIPAAEPQPVEEPIDVVTIEENHAKKESSPTPNNSSSKKNKKDKKKRASESTDKPVEEEPLIAVQNVEVSESAPADDGMDFLDFVTPKKAAAAIAPEVPAAADDSLDFLDFVTPKAEENPTEVAADVGLKSDVISGESAQKQGGNKKNKKDKHKKEATPLGDKHQQEASSVPVEEVPAHKIDQHQTPQNISHGVDDSLDFLDFVTPKAEKPLEASPQHQPTHTVEIPELVYSNPTEEQFVSEEERIANAIGASFFEDTKQAEEEVQMESAKKGKKGKKEKSPGSQSKGSSATPEPQTGGKAVKKDKKKRSSESNDKQEDIAAVVEQPTTVQSVAVTESAPDDGMDFLDFVTPKKAAAADDSLDFLDFVTPKKSDVHETVAPHPIQNAADVGPEEQAFLDTVILKPDNVNEQIAELLEQAEIKKQHQDEGSGKKNKKSSKPETAQNSAKSDVPSKEASPADLEQHSSKKNKKNKRKSESEQPAVESKQSIEVQELVYDQTNQQQQQAPNDSNNGKKNKKNKKKSESEATPEHDLENLDAALEAKKQESTGKKNKRKSESESTPKASSPEKELVPAPVQEAGGKKKDKKNKRKSESEDVRPTSKASGGATCHICEDLERKSMFGAEEPKAEECPLCEDMKMKSGKNKDIVGERPVSPKKKSATPEPKTQAQERKERKESEGGSKGKGKKQKKKSESEKHVQSGPTQEDLAFEAFLSGSAPNADPDEFMQPTPPPAEHEQPKSGKKDKKKGSKGKGDNQQTGNGPVIAQDEQVVITRAADSAHEMANGGDKGKKDKKRRRDSGNEKPSTTVTTHEKSNGHVVGNLDDIELDYYGDKSAQSNQHHQEGGKKDKKKNKGKNNSTSEQQSSIISDIRISKDEMEADKEIASITGPPGQVSPPIQVHEVSSTAEEDHSNGTTLTTETITASIPVESKEISEDLIRQYASQALRASDCKLIESDPSVKMRIDAQLVRLAEKKPVVIMETKQYIKPLPLELQTSRPSTPINRERQYKLLPKDIIFCSKLIDNHGENYTAMANDPLNVYKENARGLQRKIRVFKESPHYQTYLRAKQEEKPIEEMIALLETH